MVAVDKSQTRVGRPLKGSARRSVRWVLYLSQEESEKLLQGGKARETRSDIMRRQLGF